MYDVFDAVSIADTLLDDKRIFDALVQFLDGRIDADTLIYRIKFIAEEVNKKRG